MRRAIISLTICLLGLLSGASVFALYGGTPMPPGEGSAVAFLQFRAGQVTGSCSGVLIDERAVLTAAHCIRSSELGRHRIRSVRVGNPRGETVRRRVESVHVHPDFDVARPEAGSDLAVIRLRQPIEDRTPLRLATSTEEPTRQGQDLLIAGFGVTRARSRRANAGVLRSITLGYLSPFHCFSGPVEQMAATRMCAASPSTGVCPGDSGSAAIVRIDDHDVVVGIVSLAIDRRVCSDSATVVTKVAPFRAWIEATVTSSG